MNAAKWLVIFLIVVLVVGPVFSQVPAEKEAEEAENEEKQEKTSLVKGFFQDEGKILTAPLRFKTKDWLLAAGAAAVTGVLIHNDEAIYREVKEFQDKHEWVDKISQPLERFTRQGIYGAAALFVVAGLLFKDKRAAETGSLALQAALHSFVVIQIIKHLTGRQRPSWENGIDGWHGLEGFFGRYESGQWSKYDAFASGHTIGLWSIAAVVATQYRHKWWVPVISYTVATLGGLGTMTADLHWLSDVFFGAVLGYAIGKFVVRRRSTTLKRFNIEPVVSSHRIGIGLTYRF